MDVQIVQRGARKLRTKENPAGQPLSVRCQDDSMTKGRPLQLTKPVKAYEALFLNCDGVAAGRAMIIARHSLKVRGSTFNPNSCLARKEDCLQNVQNDVDGL